MSLSLFKECLLLYKIFYRKDYFNLKKIHDSCQTVSLKSYFAHWQSNENITLKRKSKKVFLKKTC